MQKTPETLVKVVLLGSVGVGKSSILKRYVEETFQENEDSTMGAAFHTKKITYKNKVYRFQIWDTAGQEKYAPLAVMYYRDAQAVLLVYDITSKETFNSLQEWQKEVKNKGPSKIISVVVGNKIDLIEKEQVDQESAMQYAESIGAVFKTASAKENIGIREVFDKIAEKLHVEHRDQPEEAIQNSEMKTTLKGDVKTKKDLDKSGCC